MNFVVPLETPVTKNLQDGTVVVYDHIWISYFSAQAANPNGVSKVKLIMYKARFKENGERELYDGEEPTTLETDKFFEVAATNPAWAMIMYMIIQQAKLWAQSKNIPM